MRAVDYVRGGVAELVGTFALVFVGAGSIIYGDVVAIALASGLVVAVMATALLHVSTGLFNPAITFALLVTRRIRLPLALVYWLGQFGGAALGALLLEWIIPENALAALGAPSVSGSLSNGQAVVLEAVLAFLLLWVVFAAVVDRGPELRQVAGFAVGFAVAFGILVGAGLTGGTMNPARALGPLLVSNTWDDWWVWFVGPLAGATIGGVLYEMLYLRRPAAGADAAGPESRPTPALGTTAAGTDASD